MEEDRCGSGRADSDGYHNVDDKHALNNSVDLDTIPTNRLDYGTARFDSRVAPRLLKMQMQLAISD